MNFDFELILFYATIVTGVIALIDLLFFRKRREKKNGDDKLPVILDYAYSFFPVLLIVFLLRSFLFEPFRIPTGSLEPTLLVGDFVLVNKYDYGIRLPVLHKRMFGDSVPQRGDIMVFRWPPNPSFNFIKRVIGLPGDKISYIDKELTVNGVKVPQEYVKESTARDVTGALWKPQEKSEDLLGVKHNIYINPSKYSRDFRDLVVPEGMYFVMGDNRDDSADSRFFGFVPDKNVVGKAVLVWLSWDNEDFKPRWNRMGKLIH